VNPIQRKDIGKEIELLQVVLDHPQDVPKLRDKILDLSEVYDIREHDIPFYRRYLIDNALFPMGKVIINGRSVDSKYCPGITNPGDNITIFEIEGPPKQMDGNIPDLNVLSFDIEVRNPKGMPDSSEDEIIMISLAGNNGFEKILSTKESSMNCVERVEDEKEMISRFVEIIKIHNPQIIMGYNSDNFDFPYINDRAKKLGVPLKLGLDGSELKFLRRGFVSAAVIRGRVHVCEGI
jgi:DNA polymerase I